MLILVSRATLEYSERLRGRKIRLLNLKPGSGDEVIHFDLETHSLDECPSYIALSYTWGDSADTVPVLGGGKVVEVTRNLKDALWQLRENRKRLLRGRDLGAYRSQSLRFWIDAVCINQLDLKEKTRQVRMMAEIYKCAWRVFAWLGLADETTDMVVDHLNKIGKKAEDCGMAEGCAPYVTLWREFAFGPVGHREVGSLHITFTRVDGTTYSVPTVILRDLFNSISGWAGQDDLLPIAGIKRFLTRSWWGRIWVLQEVTFAKDADFICGSKKIDKTRCSAAINAYIILWDVLYAAFRRDSRSLNQYQKDVVQHIFLQRPRVMLSMSRVHRQGGFGLPALLRMTCVGTINPDQHGPHHLESTKPEDKIFALLGLAVDREELMHLGVSPRYGIPYEQVYATTMVALLRQGHISLLSMCQTPRSSTLPSWVPDWSRPITDMLQDVENDHETLYPVFNASGDHSRRSTVKVLRGQETVLSITLMSHIYDEIHQVGHFHGRADDRVIQRQEISSWPAEWLLEIVRLTYYNKNKYRRFADRLSAAGRTSIGDICCDKSARLVRAGNSRFMESVGLLQRGSKTFLKKHMKIDAERFLASQAAKGTLRGSAESMTLFGSEISGRSLGRLPFITKQGSLGLSSVHIKPGDVVAVILGSQVPFVLRPHGEGRYLVISEAYVDGIMDGEATFLSDCSPIVLV